MSLKRLSEELDFKINLKLNKVIKEVGEITVRSSLIDYAYLVSDSILETQVKLIDEINKNQDLFYTSARGVNELNIIISSSVSDLVDEIFKNEKRTHKVGNLSSITVKLPKANVTTPGVFYYIFQQLAWEGVIIQEVISTTNEFTIIVHDDQIDTAFRVIKELKNKED
ncbi:aspartate kinase [Flavobacterium sp.]|uniref:aspartate kinase n=1 Tax=Flavobacterium sp. TaxID=239 RepID=UPI0035274C9A